MSIILQGENISFQYQKREVLHHLSFSIEKGTYTSIIGPNGSGKTTLFNILSGFFPHIKGTVRIEGKDLKKFTIEERSQRIAMINQGATVQFPFTCLETVLMGAHPYMSRFQTVNKSLLYKAKSLMEKTDTYQFAGRNITSLSGGEMQRVLISRALMQKPQILLLDEAMSELDVSSKFTIENVLKQSIKEEGLTILAIHHDLSLAYRFSDTLIALKGGEIVDAGCPHTVCNEDFFKDVFHVKAQIYPHTGFIIQEEC